MNRRKFHDRLQARPIVGTYASMKLQRPPTLPDGPPGDSAVAIMRARSYSDDLVSRMLEGIRQCGLDVARQARPVEAEPGGVRRRHRDQYRRYA